MSTQVNNYFQTLLELPKPFTEAQYILFKEELLICSGQQTNDCYSYHTLKKQYKYICSHPNDIQLSGHYENIIKQTFSMKYKSGWEIDDHNNNNEGVHGLIGEKNNNLLFITQLSQNIEVIDLKTMKSLNGIKNDIIPKKKI
ncbi:hypothetical protein RFI_25837 [Reticulomyxa filosa]|uniref:Uncharacterized protein n=1 Tax=Reticulomyxa filosa TaxID=46433 RepID=X6MEQ7_RETFI|nr:hypothetical protein RFI_25837 [Reticulomyxa filosa]|eukprot:ETO11540.1 hypothetical protein RFI_25837 [Reticulomyxa filosa]